jgi:hypothetical protein
MSRHRDGRALLATGALLLAAACGGGGPDDGDPVDAGRPEGFAATADYLRDVAEASTSQPYQFTVRVTSGGAGQAELDHFPLVSGAHDGTWLHQVVAVGKLQQELAPSDEQAIEVDARTETIANDEVVYVRAALGEHSTIVPLDSILGGLGDAWGRIDLTRIDRGRVPPQLAALLGAGQTIDPQIFLGLVTRADDVGDLPAEQIHGQRMSGLAASILLADLLAGRGVDPTTAAAVGIDDEIADAKVRIEAWIDQAGHVARLDVDLGAALTKANSNADQSTELVNTIDFTHYGDPAIEVIPPSSSIDITDKILARTSE